MSLPLLDPRSVPDRFLFRRLFTGRSPDYSLFRRLFHQSVAGLLSCYSRSSFRSGSFFFSLIALYPVCTQRVRCFFLLLIAILYRRCRRLLLRPLVLFLVRCLSSDLQIVSAIRYTHGSSFVFATRTLLGTVDSTRRSNQSTFHRHAADPFFWHPNVVADPLLWLTDTRWPITIDIPSLLVLYFVTMVRILHRHAADPSYGDTRRSSFRRHRPTSIAVPYGLSVTRYHVLLLDAIVDSSPGIISIKC